MNVFDDFFNSLFQGYVVFLINYDIQVERHTSATSAFTLKIVGQKALLLLANSRRTLNARFCKGNQNLYEMTTPTVSPPQLKRGIVKQVKMLIIQYRFYYFKLSKNVANE